MHMGQAEIDFLKIKNQREKIEELSWQLEKWIKFDWDEITEEIKYAWDGEESVQFLRKMYRNREKLMEISQFLKEAKEEISILEQKIMQ